MTPLVSQLWPQFMVDPAFASCFGQVIVEHARMLRQSQQVIFTLRSAAPLDKGLCARLLASLQPDYEGFELKIENLFGYAMLDEAALRDLMEEMKRDGVPINGFLDRCTIGITGQKITIGVCHGTKFLQEMGFEKLLAERIAAHTGVKPQVTLQSAVSEAEQHQMEEKLERKIAPPVVKFEKKNTAPSIKVEGLDLTDKPVTIFHGKMFTPKNLTPLKDLGGEGGKCTIWGDVFFSEVKGNYRKIYTVSITDYQGSINLKIRAQEGEDCSKWESLGKGTTLIVRGDCSYDKYEHDYIVYPYDVLIVERKKREDTAPVKRVELHLHTKLSSMDGFCDPGGIVKLAHRMGHPAIAITDHGVCQGYPEAMLAADDIHKTDPDFKLIYGCEAYFVDDMVPCVYGVKDQPLDGEFCLHAASDLPVGTIGVTAGSNNAAVDGFKIIVHGVNAHVSTPQLGADALYVASQIVVAAQALTTRRHVPTEPMVIGIGTLNAGTAYNIVAGHAELEGTTRTLTPETRAAVREQIDALAKQTAALYGATADVEWTDITPALINPADFSADVQAQARKLEGVNVITNRPVSLGGDNFAEYQQKVPGVYAYLGTRDPENPNTALAHHNDGFDLGEKALPYGTALYAQVALWWLQEGAEQA